MNCLPHSGESKLVLGKGFGIRWNSRDGHMPPPWHQVIAGEARWLYFPAPLAFGWNCTPCQENVSRSDIYVTSEMTWLSTRCLILHTLPPSASWVPQDLPCCSTRWWSQQVEVTWFPEPSLEENCLTQYGLWWRDLGVVCMVVNNTSRERHWQRTGLREVLSQIWLWGRGPWAH